MVEEDGMPRHELQLDGNQEELVIDGVLTTQPELGPSVPDGGYGWVVFLATLFFQALIPSLVVSFGMFLALAELPNLTKEDINPFLWDNRLIYTPLLFIASWTFFEPTARALISTNTWPRLVATSGTCLTCAGILFLWMGMAGYGEASFYPLSGIVAGIGREKIISQLEEEANEAHSAFEEISSKWSTIQKYNDPLHIHEDITNQKEKCELLIKQKDGIIAMLREEIKNSERKFTRDQRRQEEDINRLAQRIEKQMVFMRHAYRTELELIEQVMLDERKKHIEKADKRWEELYKERERLEIENSEEKFEQVERFNKKISELREDFYERFRKTKIDLDDDIAELRQNFEDIKALALLNREKLDYNYQILKKREDENLLLKTQQKRRLNKLHDVISELKVKIADYEKASRNKIRKFKENIDNMKKQINEIEAKADHFAKVNDDRFNQIWSMNETTCQEVLNKILAIDKVIYEQQLGIPWEPPSTTLLKKTALRSYKAAVRLLSKTEGQPKTTKSHALTPSDSLAASPSQLTTDPSPSEEERPSKLYRTLIRKILGQVADKAGFLSEKRLKVLLKNYVTEHQHLVKLDNMFLSLGIRTKEEVEGLIKHFLPYSYCLVCKGSTLETKSSIAKHPLAVNRMSSVVFGPTSFENADVYELDEAFMAIQQPENVITEIVNDLVSSDNLEEKTQCEEDEDQQYDVCGGPLLDQTSIESKEKIIRKRATYQKEKIRCPYNHPMFLPSVYIMIGLRDFVADYYRSLVNYPTMNERVKKQRKTISRMLSNEDMQQFWQKFRSVCGEEKLNLWEATFRALKEYHEILKDRKTLSEEVVGLRRQNKDLRKLLANYIDAGIGASIQMSQCEIILAQYFRLKHTFLAYVSQAVSAAGFVAAPMIVGHHVLSSNLLNVILWYQAIIIQGLIFGLTFKKPAYLKTKRPLTRYNYHLTNPDDEEDILSKNSRELQIKRQDVTGSGVVATIEKHEINGNPPPPLPQEVRRDWETFDDDLDDEEDDEGETTKYEALKGRDWETFEDDEESIGKPETGTGKNSQEVKEGGNRRNLQLELAFDTSTNNGVLPYQSSSSSTGNPMPLFTDSPVNNNTSYSYDLPENDPSSLGTDPVVFAPARSEEPHVSSLDILKRMTFYKSLLTVMTTKFSVFVFYSLFPLYLYQEVEGLRMRGVANVVGLLGIANVMFSAVSYWINVDKKRRPICMWLLCWIGSFGYFMTSDSNTEQVLIMGAVQITVSIATLQYVGMPLLGLTLRGETNKEFNLISVMTGVAFVFFFLINASFKNCFRLMALLHFFTGAVWFANYIYKRIMKWPE